MKMPFIFLFGFKAIPRVVSFDVKTGSNLLQWPVNEVEKLRTSCEYFNNIELRAGSVVPLEVPSATQVSFLLPFNFHCKTKGEAQN